MARQAGRSIRFLIIVPLLSVWLVAWGGDGALDVYLKRDCYATGGRLRLSDVIQSADGNQSPLDFDSIPLPYTAGRLAVLRPGAVRAALRSVYSGPLVLVGRDVLVMPKESINDGNKRFYTALLDFIADRIPAPAKRIEVQLGDDAAPAAAPPENPSFILENAAVRNGMKAGPARIAYRGANAGSGDEESVGVVLHVFVEAAAPGASIPAGGRFRANDLSPCETDLAGCDSDLLLFDKAEGAYTARSSLAANEPISLRKIARSLFVRAGDRVAITFVRKNVTVDMRGRALSSGTLDETVAVRPDQSNRRFKGLVTGEREVLIELD